MKLSRRRFRHGALALGLSSVLAVSACAEAGSGGAQAGPAIGGGTSSLDWALNYTGGHSTAASGDPIKIGFVNGDTIFPDSTAVAQGAARLVNEKLGGVKGRPLQLVTCTVDNDDNGRDCATQMINSGVPLVVVGAISLGGGTFYGTLAGRIPTYVSVAIAAPDRSTPNTYNYEDSAVSSTGLVKFAGTLAPAGTKTVAVGIDSPSGRDALDRFIAPGLRSAGLNVTTVPVARDATAPQIATALTAAGAGDAKLIVNNASPGTCSAVYDALQQIPNSAQVVDAGSCLTEALTQHLKDLGVKGDFPDGWYFVGGPYSPFLPTDKGGVNTYLQGMKDYAPQIKNFYSPFTIAAFNSIITATAQLNSVPGQLTAADIITAMTHFGKDPMMAVGKPECGWAGAGYPGTCVRTLGIYQYKDSAWKAVNSGLNDNALTVEQLPAA